MTTSIPNVKLYAASVAQTHGCAAICTITTPRSQSLTRPFSLSHNLLPAVIALVLTKVKRERSRYK